MGERAAMGFLLGLVLGLVLGCQSRSAYDGTDPVDGSRLVALRFSDASDGTPLVGLRSRLEYSFRERNAQVWFDRELGERCRFVKSPSDGMVHCMPDAALMDHLALDEACISPLAHVPRGCDVPRYVSTSFTAYMLGERTGRAYVQPFCQAVEGAFYRRGEQVDNSLFAAADEVTRRGVELDFVDFVMRDGAREIAGASWRDGTSVDQVRVSPTEMAFLPRAYTLDVLRPEYLDPACSRMITDAFNAEASNLRFVTDPCGLISCSPGEAITVDTVYVRQGGACVASPGQRKVRECTDLAASAPRFSIEVIPGTGRLRPFDYVSAAGDRVPGGVFDTEKNARCTPTLVDGGSRAVCVPDAVPDVGAHLSLWLYSDPACTQGSYVSYACGGAAPITADPTGDKWCREPVATVHLHTSAVTTPLYLSTETGCVPYEPPPGVTIYDSAATVPVTDLAELTLAHP